MLLLRMNARIDETCLSVFNALSTGLRLHTAETLNLQNGQVAGDLAWDGSPNYAYFDTLPADLAQVFAETAARVTAELDK